MADNIIQNLHSLPVGERRDFLQKLVRNLSPGECDFLRTSISQRCDPFWVLPTELVLQIFSHLSLFSTWTLQPVCKRWQETLSSEDFLRAAVARWQTHDPSDSGLDRNGGNSIQSQVLHIQAVKTGRPLSVRTINDTGTGLQGPQPKLAHRRLDFKGRRIAYISSHQGQGDAVVVCDLVNGEERIFRGEARERILLVVITTHMVTFITFDGCLYVWPFSAPPEELSRVQLPSSNIRAAAGNGASLAIAMGGLMTYVVLFNAEAGHLQSFKLSYGPFFKVPVETNMRGLSVRNLNSVGMLVDVSGTVVDLFFLMTMIISTPDRKEKYLRITHHRWTSNGYEVTTDIRDQEIDFETSIRDYQFLMAAPCPTGYRNIHRIAVCEVAFMGGLPFRLKFDALFDSQCGTFIPDENDPLKLRDENGQLKLRDMDVLWKGQSHRPCIGGDWLEYVFYMNDTYMVSLEVSKRLTQQSRIRLLCFDPRVDMVGSEETSRD